MSQVQNRCRHAECLCVETFHNPQRTRFGQGAAVSVATGAPKDAGTAVGPNAVRIRDHGLEADDAKPMMNVVAFNSSIPRLAR